MNEEIKTSSIDALKRAIYKINELKVKLDFFEKHSHEPIAIIGIGCRLPGQVQDANSYWRLLAEGKDAISSIPADRWDIEQYFNTDPGTPGTMYTIKGGFIQEIDQFDYELFGITKREADSMDPQQRILLEVVWEALEDARIKPRSLAGTKTGVFVGVSTNDYARMHLHSGNVNDIDIHSFTGVADSITSGRISYTLDLKGPNLAIDTACSSSLVALHLACQSLKLHESDLMIVGGCNVIVSPENTIYFCKVNALSPDGQCKTFDADANGYVRSEGCGVVVLKRLSDALRDNDPIISLIRGSAVNHDGLSQGLTAPNGTSQKKLIEEALKNANVTPEEISYVEAHGTGTPLGDPIEVRALGEALHGQREPGQPLLIGSVKTNIGHLEAAAGIAGLIKLALSLQHRLIPASIHFNTPNPHIDWQSLPVKVVTELQQWPDYYKKRIAGISAFGFSGTNAHIILEEAPERLEQANKSIRPPIQKTIFQRQSCWINKVAPPVSMALVHPLLGQRDSISSSPDINFSAQISLNTASFIRDHQVLGHKVMPATGYIEMVIAALHQLHISDGFEIKDIVYHQPLIIEENETKAVKLFINDEFELSFRIVSLCSFDVVDKEEWILHATGTVSRSIDEGFSIPKFKDLLSTESVLLNHHDFYELMQQKGYDFGLSHQGVSQVRKGNHEAIGLIELPELLEKDVGQYIIHPALLDACCQVLLTLLPDVSREQVFVTMRKKSVVWFGNPQKKMIVRASVLKPYLDSSTDFTGDIEIYSETHELIAMIQGYYMRRTLREIDTPDLASLFYEIKWSESAFSYQDFFPDAMHLIFANSTDDVEQLAKVLCAKNLTYLVVIPASNFVQQNESTYQIDLDDMEYFLKFIRTEIIKNNLNKINIINLLPLQRSAFVEADSLSLSVSLKSTFILINAISQAFFNNVYLTTVTCQAQYLLSEQCQFNKSPILALIRVAMVEYPTIQFKYIDIDNKEFASIPHFFDEIFTLTNESEVILRANKRFIPRLVRENITAYTRKTAKQLYKIKEGLDCLEWKSIQRVDPGINQVEIKVLRAGLNFKDLLTLLGHKTEEICHFLNTTCLDNKFGLECAGVITKIGPQVNQFKIGDQVIAFDPGSEACKTFITLDEYYVVPKPDSLTLDEAVSIATVFPTAYYGLCHFGQIKSGDRVLIHAAAGGIGLAAIQIAQEVGAEIYATAHPDKWSYLKNLGVHHIMNSRTTDFADEIQQITDGRGVDIILNSLSGEFTAKSRLILAANGRFIELGTEKNDEVSTAEMAKLNQQFISFHIIEEARTTPKLFLRYFQEIVNKFDLGIYKPLPVKVYAASEIMDAFRFMQQSRHIGKLVINMESLSDSEKDFDFNHLSEGTVLITGGLGGLGFETAQWLISKGASSLALLSRSKPSDVLIERIEVLKSQNKVQIGLYQVDVADRDELSRVIENIALKMKPLNGVIHAAGIMSDSLLQQETWNNFVNVYNSKAEGAWNLHLCTQGLNLDFFVMYSSITSILGSVGTGSYAVANAYLDILAQYRNNLGLPALSINWGAWSDVGMGTKLSLKEQKNRLQKGLGYMKPSLSLNALELAMWTRYTNLIIAHFDWSRYIDGDRVKNHSLIQSFAPIRTILEQKMVGVESSKKQSTHSLTDIKQLVCNQLSQVLRIDLSEIDEQATFSDMGIDSLMGIELRNRIQHEFGDAIKISVVVVFDYPTIPALAEYIHQCFSEVNADSLCSIEASDVNVSMSETSFMNCIEEKTEDLSNEHHIASFSDDIAIIGCSGRFPGAANINEFWSNLSLGTSSVTEIPLERWSIDDFYDPSGKLSGKSYCKWGGFLSDIDKFDSLFFNISPAAADYMDPQQRLFLEECWNTFEDAGYSDKTLSGQKCGVFVGVITGDYDQLAKNDENALNANSLLGMHCSILASRISYQLNLTGPSLSINTACSSSLVALHEACRSIQAGESTIALVGGVCVLTTAKLHILASQAGMLSLDGQCKTFDEDANGFVPGEGVGVVLLKRLDEALRDNDHIDAVIKGSAINQDGRTNGITAPSALSQKNLELEVYQKFDINPETISYVESHGTGTKLGDPIEIEALTNAFNTYSNKEQFCAIGSVKTNIGHSMAAAGVASLIKIILCLRHNKLVPSLNFHHENTHINFNKSPFYVNTQYKDWESESGAPKRAAISSFGFSGTNAHVIIEEAPKILKRKSVNKSSYLITLSARTDEALQQKIQDLALWLQKPCLDSLEDLSYTLNAGRTHFDKRCSLVVSDINQLKERLAQLNNSVQVSDVFMGDSHLNTDDSEIYEQALLRLLDELKETQRFESQEYKKSILGLAKIYAKGYDIDWDLLHQGESKQRVSLPTYPFANEKHWLSISEESKFSPERVTVKLHPLIDSNVSTLHGLRFIKSFSHHEFYLADHRVRSICVLPGVVSLEMARAAAKLASPDQLVKSLRDITWVRPLQVIDKALSTSITLVPDGNFLLFKISTGEELKTQGKIDYINGNDDEPLLLLDIPAIQKRCLTQRTSNEIYTDYKGVGLDYGPSFQVIHACYSNEIECLSVLKLPHTTTSDNDGFILHPSIMDGALQSIIGLTSTQKTYLPFSLGSLDIYGALPSTCYAYVSDFDNKAVDMPRFSIQIADETGKVLVVMRDFICRALREGEEVIHYYSPVWRKHTAKSNSFLIGNVFVLEDEEIVTVLKRTIHDVPIFKGTIDDINRLDVLPSYIIYRAKGEINNDYNELLKLVAFLIGRKSSELVRLLCVTTGDSLEREAFSGMAKTVHLEHSKLHVRVIEIQSLEDLTYELDKNEIEVHYDERHIRFVKEYKELTPVSDSLKTPLRQRGIYLITGGAGGLGLIFAKYLAEQYEATLILVGRSELNTQKRMTISAIESLGVEVIYKKVDITNQEEVEVLYKEIKLRFGTINGVIHSAGVVRDSFILKKTRAQSQEVLAPKITGTKNLDWVLRNEPLDFFVLFSSMTSILGNVGQYDYAFANGFLNEFASFRNQLCHQGKRFGQTLAINWPLWAEGGMDVDSASKIWLENTLGIQLLKTDLGISAFLKALEYNQAQVIVAPGRSEKIVTLFHAASILKETQAGTSDLASKDTLLDRINTQITIMIADLLKLKLEHIQLNEDLSEYGMDSISFTDFSNKVNDFYHIDLTPAVMFEHKTLAGFGCYLLENYESEISSRYQDEVIADEVELLEVNSIKPLDNHFIVETTTHTEDRNEDIAIIGMSGSFPGSSSLEQYWDNLLNQNDLITEIPVSRWDWHTLYQDGDEIKKIRWGGFVEGIGEFGAEFFGISSREAVLMDPQQRLFLQTVWQAMEHANYLPQSLAQTTTGVFVGVSSNDYNELIQKIEDISAHVSTGNAHSVLANRVSYLLNLSGPSVAVDTACSSSLVALHLAVKAIQSHDCELAIAGGVSALITPTLYLQFTKAGMLCEDGRCKTFDKNANGYVRGEGVGAVILKSLDKALIDGDKIYGIIKGTAVNHGGHVSSLTVPNPVAQAALILSAVERAQIGVETISYIEAHGTGTALGDPIEVNGLKKAFSMLQEKQQLNVLPTSYCGLGSVKTNIGHLEAASGIAGLIKVLLAMQQKMLPGLVNFQEINPYIKLDNSPFYLVTKSKPWELLRDQLGREVPRRAGISSFGFGGTNAHVILEEGPESQGGDQSIQLPQDKIFVLSAKSRKSLDKLIGCYIRYLEKQEEQLLDNICYTAATARSHYNYRIALSVKNIIDLINQLKNVEVIFVEMSLTQDLYVSHDIRELIGAYFEGKNIDWSSYYMPYIRVLRKVSIPTYCFDMTRYWVDIKPENSLPYGAIVHPFLGVKIPGYSKEIRYINRLDLVGLPYLKSHCVYGQVLFPGAGFIESALAVGVQIFGEVPFKIEDATFLAPLVLKEKTEYQVSLESVPNGSYVGMICASHNGGESWVKQVDFSLDCLTNPQCEVLDLNKLQTSLQSIDISLLYQEFSEMGIDYGEAFQSIKEAFVKQGMALVKIENDAIDPQGYYFHPSLLDGVFQAVVLVLDKEQSVVYIPSMIREIDWYQKINRVIWAQVVLVNHDPQVITADMKIYDENGMMLADIKGFVARRVEKKTLKNQVLSISDDLVENKSAQIDRDKAFNPNAQNATHVDPLDIAPHGEWLVLLEATPVENREEVLGFKIRNLLSDVLKIKDSSSIDANRGFSEMGMDSLMAIDFKNRLQIKLGTALTLENTFVFDYSNLKDMRDYLISRLLIKEGTKELFFDESNSSDEDIAIIGFSGEFPGSPNIDSFWQMLVSGNEGISEVPASRWDINTYYDKNPRAHGKVITRYGGFLQDIDQFDAGFFGINPKKANYLDPQQRLLLKHSWLALESACIAPHSLYGSDTGVFVGMAASDYGTLINKYSNFKDINAYYGSGIALSTASGRISYTLGLQGPSLTIDTACASSLVALNEACIWLKRAQCSVAIVGGVNAILVPNTSIYFSRLGMLAPDGKCKTFDYKADGFVRGEGCGIVILKRLSDAIRDNDVVVAVIKSSGVNQNGTSSGLTVPNGQAQVRLIKDVLRQSKLNATEIDYVECHGTGTPLGDSIEAHALGAVYGINRKNLLYLGSVKTNIGHLEAAAGISGLIKTVLSLQHRKMPKHLNFTQLNSNISFNFPVEIVNETMDWNSQEWPRRAALSAFGFSGTNAHVILEEAPMLMSRDQSIKLPQEVILVLSAKTKKSLNELNQRYIRYLETSEERIEDICYTAAVGRSHFVYRVALVAQNKEELLNQLKSGTLTSVQIPLVDEIVRSTDIHLLYREYLLGKQIDWSNYYKPYLKALRKVNSPTYCFDTQQYWVDFNK